MAFKIERLKEYSQITTFEDSVLGIMRWGENNSFPQTFKNLINQSSSAKPAIDRASNFYAGAHFLGEDTVVNTSGQTLKSLVKELSIDYAMFNAFAIQANYNLAGQIVGLVHLKIEDLRFNQFDELNYSSKIGYYENYGYNSEIKKTAESTVTASKIRWIDRFNPDAVLSQINKTEGGISNYAGQILYYSESGYSSYPIPKLQCQVNFILAEIESSILLRKETTTGFISSYILKTTMSASDSRLEALQEAIASSQGARGMGKVITMSGLSDDDVKNSLLEEIGSGAAGTLSIIGSIEKSLEICKKAVNGAYLIPPILGGSDQKTGFSAPDLDDAYKVFNALTQTNRETLGGEINKLLINSIFPINEIKLTPLPLIGGDEDTSAIITNKQ